MAEDYSCPKFNSYNDTSTSQLDPTSLYVKNVPGSLSHDAFLSLMSEKGRKVTRMKLYDTRPGFDTTIALVSFESSKDAEEVMTSLDKRPPFKLQISFAKKKSSNKQDCNYTSPQSQTSHPSSHGAGPSFPGVGRGRGKGLESYKFPSLKIVLEGDSKRVASYSTPKPEVKEVSSEPSDLPKLVENPFLSCLACDNVGKFSCGTCKKPYCSPKCQVEDWHKHKLLCRPLSVGPKKARDINSTQKTSRDSSYVSESSSSDTEKKSSTSPLSKSSISSKPATNNSAVKPVTINKIIKVEDIESYMLPTDKPVQVKVCQIQSPSKFWVHLKTSEGVLSQMEKDMASFVDKMPTAPLDINNVCCAVENKEVKRVNILQTNQNKTCLVQFLDYGNTGVVQNQNLFAFPNNFKQIPYQAICCKLVDTHEGKDTVWNDDEIAFFKMEAINKSYTARVIRYVNKVFEINLRNDDDISLHSVITGLKKLNLPSNETSCSQDDSHSLKPSISVPSVCSNLKDGAEVRVVAVESEDDKFWGILDDGSDLQDNVDQLENLLQSLNSKEVNMYCEEGDVVAGFSVNFQQFYRCVVLKRMRDSFVVRFIDYGNKEEVTKLHELTPNVLSKCCYVVCCIKPDSLTQEDFQRIFPKENAANVSVIRTVDGSVKLSFVHNKATMSLNCFPWYYGISNVKSETVISKPILSAVPTKVVSTQKDKVNSAPPTAVKPLPKITPDKSPSEKRITSELIGGPTISDGAKYSVKVIFIINVSKLYVQLLHTDKDLCALSEQINKYCTSNEMVKYTPIRNEIVCCKYKGDGNWYRGQVIGKRGNTYTVFFVDFGNEDVIVESDMRPLPEKFAISKFSMCVSLHDVRNEELNDEQILSKLTSECWDMEVVNSSASPIQVRFFQENKSLIELINKKKAFTKSSLTFKRLPAGKSDVFVCHSSQERVFLQLAEDSKAIIDYCDKINSASKVPLDKKALADNIYCGLFDGLWYRACVDKLLSPTTCQVTFVDFGNQETIELNDLREISGELLDFPVLCVPAIPQNIKISQMQQQIQYLVEVVGEKSGTQLIKVLNVPKKDLPNVSFLKKSSLKNGTNQVVLCHFEKGLYYCQQCADADSFANLTNKLESFSKEKPPSEELSVGSVYCVKSSDGGWYRGAIEAVSDNKNYKISFIDFGNTETVSDDSIMYLSDELVQYPVLCIPLKISNSEKAKNHLILNTPLEVRTTGLSTEGIELVEVVLPKLTNLPEISTLEKRLLPLHETIDITLCHAEDDVLYAQMVSDQDHIKSLEAKLTSTEEYEILTDLPEVGVVICAKFTDNVWYRGSVEESCNASNSCRICFIDYGNCENINMVDMKILPAEVSSIPVLSIPVRFESIEKLQDKLRLGVTNFLVRVLSVSEEGVHLVELVEPELQRVVTSISSQLLTDLPVEVSVCYEEDDVYYVQKVSDFEKLKEMTLMLNNSQSLKAVTHIPKVGEFVVFKYQDNNWYRGLIRGDLGGDIFKVFFIDFGNTDKINKKDICYLPPAYVSFPMFSIPVRLSLSSKATTRLLNEKKYTVKRIGCSQDNIQTVKVRPILEPFLLSSMKSCVLEDGTTSVRFQSFNEKFHFVTKSSDCDKMVELNTLLSSFEGEDIFETPTVGEVLIVKSNDKLWHRGCIQTTHLNSGQCEVFLIDSGKTEDIPILNMCYMPAELASFPIFSIKVLLNAPDSLKKTLSFDKSYDVFVLQLVKDIPTIQIHTQYMLSSLKRQHLPIGKPRNVAFCHKEQNVLFLQDSADILRIGELLAEVQACSSSKHILHRPAVGELLVAQSSFDSCWYRCCVEEIISCDSYKIQFIDYGNSEIVSKEKLRGFKSKLIEYPSLCTAVKVSNISSEIQLTKVYTVTADSQPQGNEPQIVHLVREPQLQQAATALTENGNLNGMQSTPSNTEISQVSNSKKYFFDDCNCVPFPPGEQDVFIFTVIEKCHAFCAPFDKKNLFALNALTETLTKHCNELGATSYNGSEAPQKDEMVLAKYGEDEWYRAVIVEHQYAPFYDVLFIDFGNSDRLGLKHLRKMEERFMSLDIQAHLCKLTGFSCKEENLEAVTRELTENFVGKALKGTVSVIEVKGDVERCICIKQITEHLKAKKLV